MTTHINRLIISFGGPSIQRHKKCNKYYHRVLKKKKKTETNTIQGENKKDESVT